MNENNEAMAVVEEIAAANSPTAIFDPMKHLIVKYLHRANGEIGIVCAFDIEMIIENLKIGGWPK